MGRREKSRLDAEAESRWRAAGVLKRHDRHLVTCEGPWGDALTRLSSRAGEGYIVALLGPRGTGKTQMAVEALRHQIFAKGRTGRYVRAMDIFLSIKNTYDGDGSEHGVLQAFARPDLLVVDEIQERGETAWEDRMLTHLLDSRYGMVKDTIIIGNQTQDAFAESIGESVYSRLTETGGWINCNWKSFRAKESG